MPPTISMNWRVQQWNCLFMKDLSHDLSPNFNLPVLASGIHVDSTSSTSIYCWLSTTKILKAAYPKEQYFVNPRAILAVTGLNRTFSTFCTDFVCRSSISIFGRAVEVWRQWAYAYACAAQLAPNNHKTFFMCQAAASQCAHWRRDSWLSTVCRLCAH